MDQTSSLLVSNDLGSQDCSARTEPDRDVCVIVPMFNEAVVIHEVVLGLRASFSRVICVDDGSSDDSAMLATVAGAQVVRHPVNLGQGAALQTGLSFALRDESLRYFLTFDADGQHQVADALRMLGHARDENVDVVLGSRFMANPSKVPGTRRILLRGAVAFTRVTTGMRLTDTHNGLRVLNRRAATVINLRLAGMAHASEILDQIGQHQLNCEEYPVSIQYTTYSKSKGQPHINAINILFDVVADRVRR